MRLPAGGRYLLQLLGEDWTTSMQLADRAEFPRRGMTYALELMERHGLVEADSSTPRRWRRKDGA